MTGAVQQEDLLALAQPSEPLLFRSGAECMTVGATFFGRDEAGKARRVIAFALNKKGVLLEREEVVQLRQFLNVWLAQPIEQEGDTVWPDRSQDIEAVRQCWKNLQEEFNELLRAWAFNELTVLEFARKRGIARAENAEVFWQKMRELVPAAVVDVIRQYESCPLGTCHLCSKRAPLRDSATVAGDPEGTVRVCAWGCDP
jgi:hypothetical protein